jgi:cellulose synthase (UDP-forming)
MSIRFALRLASFRRREYRFPLSVPVRVASAGQPVMALATDLSPLGFRLVGHPAASARVGDRLTGAILLPTGSINIDAVVRSRTGAGGDAPGAAHAIGCEFHWASAGDCHQLEQFLFGSDLQWRLNGLEDRIRTPLERLREVFNGGRAARMLAGRRWMPLLYKGAGSGTDVGVGFISTEDDAATERTIVTLGLLPGGGRLQAEEVTVQGPRSVVGVLASHLRVDTHSTPLYVYQLTA